MKSKRLTDSAKYQPCIRCGGGQDGSVCARHYNGFRQQAYGKGMGEKCSDLASAELCARCDHRFTEGVGDRYSIERSEQFLHYCMLTNIRRAERGDLKG